MLAMGSVFGFGDPHPEIPAAVRVVPPPVPLPAPERYLPPGLPLPPRRFLDVDEAAEYVGVSATLFLEEVGLGRWPPPLRRGASGRRTTWDVRALDAAADLASGLTFPATQAASGLASAEQDILRKLRA